MNFEDYKPGSKTKYSHAERLDRLEKFLNIESKENKTEKKQKGRS